jgi:transglutaminase-like putative cysteine protease
VKRNTWIDLGVLTVLAFIAVLGFEPAFGAGNLLLAGLGGIIVGVGSAVALSLARQGVLVSVLGAILAYFLLGSAFAMPQQATLLVLPNLTTLAGLALGAVYGWADILTLTAPVQAPYYLPALPYAAAFVVTFVTAMLAIRWMPRAAASAWRAAILLIGPVLLLLAGILLGTHTAYLAGVRGIAFAVIAIVWLGWRRREDADQSIGTAAARKRTIIGGATVVAGALVVGVVAGILITPPAEDRFVLRDAIEPPFDPLAYPSPLAGFRKYTKDLSETDLFTVAGLTEGEHIRLATMDAYTGRLWDVADPAVTGDGGFSLVGTRLPQPRLYSPAASEKVTVTIDGYDDVWMPVAGFPSSVDFGSAPPSVTETLRYNADSGTAVLEDGITSGFSYTLSTADQAAVDDTALASVPIATETTGAGAMPPVADVPDVVSGKAVEYAGEAETPIAQLRGIEQKIKTTGFLSHGLASDAVPSRAGHGADRMIDLFTRSQMVGDAEQYASAMALMVRSLGYPARVVLGFAPTVPADGGEVTVVGDDITAWVEVPFQGVGWVPFFPTPERTDVPQDQVPKPKSEPQPQVRQPPRTQNRDDDLLTAVEVDDSDRDKKDDLFAVPAWVWVVSGVVGIPLLIIFLPVLIVWALKRARRRKRRDRGPADHRVAGAWEELRDRYVELGFDVQRRTTRTQTAQHIEQQLRAEGVGGPDTLVLAPVAARIDSLVWGDEVIDDADIEQAWSQTDASVEHANQAAGRIRRIVSRYRIRSKRDWSTVNLDESS